LGGLNGSLASTWSSFKSTGDLLARDALVEHYWPVVKGHAWDAPNHQSTIQDEDIAQDLYVELVRCMERFDPDQGIPFEGFVYRRLWGEARRSLNRWEFGPIQPKRGKPVGCRMVLFTDQDSDIKHMLEEGVQRYLAAQKRANNGTGEEI
jgi:hypothetical protein